MAREQIKLQNREPVAPLFIQIFVLKIVGCIDGQYDHWSCTLIINIMNFFLCLGLHEKKNPSVHRMSNDNLLLIDDIYYPS